MQPESSLPHSQQHATLPYPEAHQHSVRPPIPAHLCKAHCDMTFPTMPASSKWPVSTPVCCILVTQESWHCRCRWRQQLSQRRWSQAVTPVAAHQWHIIGHFPALLDLRCAGQSPRLR